MLLRNVVGFRREGSKEDTSNEQKMVVVQKECGAVYPPAYKSPM